MLILIFTGLIERDQRILLEETDAGQLIAIAKNARGSIPRGGDSRESATKLFFHANGADADCARRLRSQPCPDLGMA
jgi:hypothetical protein